MKNFFYGILFGIIFISAIWYALDLHSRIIIEDYKSCNDKYFVRYYNDLNGQSEWFEVDEIQYLNLKKIGWFKYEY